jgi:hypothetical protein
MTKCLTLGAARKKRFLFRRLLNDGDEDTQAISSTIAGGIRSFIAIKYTHNAMNCTEPLSIFRVLLLFAADTSPRAAFVGVPQNCSKRMPSVDGVGRPARAQLRCRKR